MCQPKAGPVPDSEHSLPTMDIWHASHVTRAILWLQRRPTRATASLWISAISDSAISCTEFIYQKNLKKLREKKGLSQDRLAKLADVANNTIIKIEQGENINPTLDTLKKIAKALEISIDVLIT